MENQVDDSNELNTENETKKMDATDVNVTDEKVTNVNVTNENVLNENVANENNLQQEADNKVIKTKEEKKKVKGSYITGIIGAIIGGLIATVPWVLMYVYGNMMLSALAIIIAAGEFYGYKLFRGKMTKALPAIIMVLSVLIVALTTFCVIPAILLHNNGLTVSMDTMKILYSNSDFIDGITKDGLIAIVFTLLGASAITANIKRKLQEGKTENIDLGNAEEIEKAKISAIEKVKPIFEKYNAVEKENGILKDDLNAEINESPELKEALSYLKSLGIVKKSKGRFYYSQEAEGKQTLEKRKKKSKIITIVIAVIFVLVIVGNFAYVQYENMKPVQVSDEVVSFEVSKNWEEFTNYYQSGWSYNTYINTPEPKADEEIEEGDYSKYPAYLNVSYNEIDSSKFKTIEDIKNTMKESIEEAEEKPSVYEDEIVKSSKGYDWLKIKIMFNENPAQVEYIYYMLNDNLLAGIDAYSFNLDDDAEIEKTVGKIADSFEWVD